MQPSLCSRVGSTQARPIGNVNIQLKAGENLFNNPLLSSTNSLSQPFSPSMLEGTTVSV